MEPFKPKFSGPATVCSVKSTLFIRVANIFYRERSTFSRLQTHIEVKEIVMDSIEVSINI